MRGGGGKRGGERWRVGGTLEVKGWVGGGREREKDGGWGKWGRPVGRYCNNLQFFPFLSEDILSFACTCQFLCLFMSDFLHACVCLLEFEIILS